MVAPTSLVAEYSVKPPAGSRNRARSRSDSGAIVANRGEKRVAVSIEDRQAYMMMFQIADVSQTLACAGRITGNRHRIALSDHDGYIERPKTGGGVAQERWLVREESADQAEEDEDHQRARRRDGC